MERDFIAELSQLTCQMADTDPGADSFGAMLERRGELMQQLCGALDAGDPRITLIERDGAALQSKLESRCVVLREELISLGRTAVVVDSVRSTLVAAHPAVNLIA
jgi:hypothetical protein